MSEATQQSTIFFGTPVNFPSLTKVAVARFLLGGEEYAYLVAAWYVHMRNIAKQGTVFGQFTTTSPHFVRTLGAAVPEPTDPEMPEWLTEAARVWDVFVDVGLIDVHGNPADPTTEFRVDVIDFDDTNVTRRLKASRGSVTQGVTMTTAERQAVRREQKRRVTHGLPRMSDEERDSWVASRRVTPSHVPSRHVTRKGEEGNTTAPRDTSVTHCTCQLHSGSSNLHPDGSPAHAEHERRFAMLIHDPDVVPPLALLRATGRDLTASAHTQRHAQDDSPATAETFDSSPCSPTTDGEAVA